MKLVILFFLSLIATNTFADTQSLWKSRISQMLSEGKIPLIDMETSYQENHIDEYFPNVIKAYDTLGIAVVAADGHQRPKDGSKGYRWSNYMLEAHKKYPNIFVPTTNGGVNRNWSRQYTGPKSFISQLEGEVSSRKYSLIGEIEFRHYMSNHQCKSDKHHRDVSVSIDGKLGDRVLGLSSKYNIPVVVHFEIEDSNVESLDRALSKHPNAKVIIAHLGQRRQPELQTKYNHILVKELLDKHKNLYFDLANGHPNRKYHCSGKYKDETIVGDNVLWETDEFGQLDSISKDWVSILEEYSDRFVFASDYGAGRRDLTEHLEKKVYNFNRLVSGLSTEARHNVSYKNAWKLLTSREWKNDEN